ncbi:MAG: XdhC family protein [Ignavibacteria bacterium]
MKDLSLWKFIQSELNKNNKVILFTVVHHEKGSPGKTGFKMTVSSNGSFTGSVGGGVMEYKLLKSCDKLFQSGKKINIVEEYFHYKGKLPGKKNLLEKESGLICSGSQIISTNILTQKDLSAIRKIISAYRLGKNIMFSLDNTGLTLRTAESSDKKRFNFIASDKGRWSFEENLGLTDILLIAGYGHVGYALSKAMSELDFRIIIYDDRKTPLLNFKKISGSKLIIDDYAHILTHLQNIKINYAVIVTTGFESDKEVLKNLINLDLKYLGLMGTKAKIKKIFNEAAKEGISKEILKKVYAPVGLDINSNTPEEIAVSIAAEIIKIRNS